MFLNKFKQINFDFSWFYQLPVLHVEKEPVPEVVEWEMSEQGLKDLTISEGFKTTLYRDTKGLPTIGVGHLLTAEENHKGYITLHSGKKISAHTKWTTEEVQELFDDDLYRFKKVVNKLAKHINQGQFDALVSFAFNIGTHGFRTSTAYKRIEAGNHEEVPDAMLMWDIPEEIIPRRMREAKAYSDATNSNSNVV